MYKLLNTFFDICLLRAGPQALPASQFLLLLACGLSLFTGTLAIADNIGGPLQALLAQLLDLLLLMGLLWLGLTLGGKQPRFTQSATALLGSGILVNLVMLPVELLVGEDPGGSLTGELGLLLYLLVMVWAVMIIGHILRHALDIRFGNGLLLALIYFFLINWLVQLLFSIK